MKRKVLFDTVIAADSWFLDYEDQISDIITISIAIEE